MFGINEVLGAFLRSRCLGVFKLFILVCQPNTLLTHYSLFYEANEVKGREVKYVYSSTSIPDRVMFSGINSIIIIRY